MIENRYSERRTLTVRESAICVQRFDDSLSSAIRITYRISLRSSSVREPRYPLLRVVLFLSYLESLPIQERLFMFRKIQKGGFF